MEDRRVIVTSQACKMWLNGAKTECDARLLELTDAKVKCMGVEQWREFVNITNGGIYA